MKQKYKVFINDKVLWFTPQAGCSEILIPEDCNGIPGKISAGEAACYCLTGGDAGLLFSRFTASFRIIEAAGGLVTCGKKDSTRLLMIYRHGKWDLPKGKIDPGEAPAETAVREIGEECHVFGLHIDAALPETWHLYQHKGNWVLKKTYWFRMETADEGEPEPALDEGIEKVEWIPLPEVPGLFSKSFASIADLLRQAL